MKYAYLGWPCSQQELPPVAVSEGCSNLRLFRRTPLRDRRRQASAGARRVNTTENIERVWPRVGVPGALPIPAPPLIQLVCEMALARRDRPAVLVLPHGEAVTSMATVLCARELAADGRRTPTELLDQLDPGDRVYILPDAGVYLFGGRESAGFWLSPLHASAAQSAARVWVPDKEAWRVQPTLRLRPMGPANRNNWTQPQPSVWDAFSGVEARSNSALGGLAVVLVGSRTLFESQLQLAGYATDPASPARSVAHGLIRGLVDEDGDVEILVPPGAAGAPLVAVARNHQAAARLSATHSERPLVFLSTRVADALSDRSAIDMIGSRHRFLLVASPRQRDELAGLRGTGWLVVEPRGLEAAPTGLAALDRAADASRWEARPPAVLDQRSPELEEAFAAFERLGVAVEDRALEEEDAVACVQILRRAFFEASDWLRAPGSEELEALEDSFTELHGRLSGLRSIAGPQAYDAAEACRSAIDRFALIATRSAMTPKGECLFQLATAASRAPQWRQAIVAGHGRSAALASAFLTRQGLSMPCLTPSMLVDHEPFSRINILSMMRREAFTRLIDPWPAPDVMFLGYGHEVGIYRHRLASRDRLRRQLGPDDADCAKYPFLARHRPPPAGPVASSPAPPAEPPKHLSASISRLAPRPAAGPGEQQRQARLCRFAGQSWMAVAVEKAMARVRPSGNGLQVTPCEARDLEAGDLLLVRDGTDRDIVRDMAESLIGPQQYANLRGQASLWRNRLIATNLSPEALRKRLAEQGVERGLAALRYWIAEEGPIGPSQEDIVVPAIAAATGDNSEAPEWARCVEAIQAIRALHTKAGFSLTEALTRACGGSLVEHSDYETPIMLPWGVVWLLEVEDAGAAEPWPYTQINRLRWDSESWRRRLLARQPLHQSGEHI